MKSRDERLYNRVSLEDSRQQAVGHSGCVTFPVLAVLIAAAMLITDAAVQQQDGHVDDVEVGQQVPAPARHAVRQCAQQVAGVVKVTCSAPEA